MRSDESSPESGALLSGVVKWVWCGEGCGGGGGVWRGVVCGVMRCGAG